MPRTRPPIHRPSRQKEKIPLTYLIPFAVACVLLVVVVTYVSIQPPLANPVTFCPQDNKDLGITALVIDVSDKLTNGQEAGLKNELKSISDISTGKRSRFLKKGEKLLVYFVEPEGRDPSIVFEMCHPGDIANRTWEEGLSEGRVLAEKKWRKFTEQITFNIDTKIKGSTELATSPIIETMQYVRNKSFPSSRVINGATNYRIILWSDLLQNSSKENHYKNLGDIETILKRKPTDLNEIQLFVFQLASDKYSGYQTTEHTVWWRNFFLAAGADLSGWHKL